MILEILLIYLLGINLVLFVTMGVDKFKARRGLWRIPEKTLFLLAIAGGSIGGILGMQIFRHKTKHNSFKFGFPAILIFEAAVIGWIVYQFAA
ncbi:MAG: DUF1294 domain-containing protein [Oscillospiraceae bacterium]|nr:DUF1294 domain-containing protein [Oscillospiraceae bacterium]